MAEIEAIETGKRLRKVLFRVAGGLLLAGGAMYGLTQAPGKLPFGITDEQLKRVGFVFVVLAAVVGFAWFVAELWSIWSAHVAHSRQGGLDPWGRLSAIADYRPQWPLYRRSVRTAKEAAMLKTEQERVSIIEMGSTHALEGLRQENAALWEQLADARSQLADASGEGARRRENLLYGLTLAELDALPDHEFAAMRRTISQLHDQIIELRSAADGVWKSLSGEGTSNPPLNWVRENVDRCERRICENTVIALLKTTQAKTDPRALLAAYYSVYWDWRQAILRFAAMLGKPISEAEGYPRWRVAEVQFAKELYSRINTDDMAIVSDAVNSLDARFGRSIADDPSYVPLLEVGEYGARVMDLRMTSPDERQFLWMFCVDTLPMSSEVPTILLARNVYDAGQRLVQKKILAGKAVADSTMRFCLPALTRYAWVPALGEEGPVPRKDCIDIPLDLVEGTKASGGGGIIPPYLRPTREPPSTPNSGGRSST